MKSLIFLNFIIATLSASVQAATVSVFANEVLATSGSFTQSPVSGSPVLSSEQLSTIVTSDVTSFVLSNDFEASIDLGFGANKAYSGSGADLVIFTVGNGYDFGLQVFDTNNNILSNFKYNVAADGRFTSVDEDGNDLCLIKNGNCVAAISAVPIDIFGNNGVAIDDNIELGFIRLFIGSKYNGTVDGQTAYPLFSLAGGFHTEATVVPLPLSAVLFSSGLALLGWIGRRKSL